MSWWLTGWSAKRGMELAGKGTGLVLPAGVFGPHYNVPQIGCLVYNYCKGTGLVKPAADTVALSHSSINLLMVAFRRKPIIISTYQCTIG